jgi:hypothetical protein
MYPRLTTFAFALAACTCIIAAPVADPAGDATPSPTGTILDIAAIDVTFDPMTLFVSITFFPGPATPLTPPSSGSPAAVVGAVEFDVDLDPTTGAPAFGDAFRPAIGHPFSGLGVEFQAMLFTEVLHPGLIDIVSPTLGPVGTVPIVYTPLALAFGIPLAMLGGDDGVVNYTAIVGDVSGPTDAAPATFATSTPTLIPEPAAFWMIGGGILGVLGARRRFRSGNEPRYQ